VRKRTLRNTIAVLVITAFTAIGVVATVQATDRIAGTDTAAAASASTAVAVQSGTAGSSQTGSQDSGQSTTGQSSSGQSSSGQSTSEQTGPYGYPMSVYTPDANGLMYCPRTGCSASSCHALQ
jgi:hypothetical protein